VSTNPIHISSGETNPMIVELLPYLALRTKIDKVALDDLLQPQLWTASRDVGCSSS
jgi:hypothetical protein